MQLSFKSLSGLLLASSAIIAVPVHRHNDHNLLDKREILTEVVRQTRIHYQRHVVVVDQNSNTISTGLEQAYVSTVSADSSPSLPSDVIKVVPEPSTTSSAAETKPTTSPSSQPSPEPTTSSTSQPSPEPTTSSTSQSSSEPTPAPESTSEPTSSSQPQSTTTQSSSPSTSSTPSEGEFSGDGTFYNTGLGACGIESNDSQFVVAVGYELYDSVNTANPNNNPLCGRKITVFRGLKSVQVTVVDKCPGCSYYSLDLSPAAFDVLGNPDEGRIPITWIWS
ncbi:Conserved hypothetical protein. Putative endoglucanase [Geotrichum candidum]|uniref:RlpA-like protein double-psi beta-barrel domain-containing protein n=1 Tax=Geotrichum candidum TaxID=1173061 RepID=A0A0J9XHY1_GEOCN|nr:Conserved hypothetical protein. Putative endoglucanase [Geotrichum candidum]